MRRFQITATVIDFIPEHDFKIPFILASSQESSSSKFVGRLLGHFLTNWTLFSKFFCFFTQLIFNFDIACVAGDLHTWRSRPSRWWRRGTPRACAWRPDRLWTRRAESEGFWAAPRRQSDPLPSPPWTSKPKRNLKKLLQGKCWKPLKKPHTILKTIPHK